MNRSYRKLSITCLLLAGAFGATAAAADWLVTLDGSRVETEGEWRVEGRRVLFTLPNGTLSAMRVSEIDLEASRAATEAANRPPDEAKQEAPDKPKPEPVLVLTDKDIPKASFETEPEGDGERQGLSTGAPDLRVLNWNVESVEGGLQVVGRIENGTDRVQSGIRLRVEVRNEEGEVLATAPSTVTQTTLVAGGITSFQARFRGLTDLPGDPTFLIESLETRRRQQEQSDEAGEQGGEQGGEENSGAG